MLLSLPLPIELYLIEAIIICLTRLLPLLASDSETHQPLFWVALGVLQLDEVSLYAAGLALLEQNLLTLDQHGTFDHDVSCTNELTLLNARFEKRGTTFCLTEID